MDTTKFAIVLIAALMLNAVLSYLQVRVYDKVTRRLANDYAGNSDFVLVSGRAKGLFRGAVVILSSTPCKTAFSPPRRWRASL
jgi:hypothetical protein